MQLTGTLPVPVEVEQSYVAQGLWDDRGLRDGLEAWAAKTPDRMALAADDRSLTYRQLEDAVARAVACLRSWGIGPSTSVVVVAPLSAEAVVGYLALVRTGAVAVMLDRRSGRADAVEAAAVHGVRLVLSTAELADKLGLADLSAPVVSYEDLLAWPERNRDWTEPDPRAPIAVVFTSGTTSRPKGAVHSLNTLRAGGRALAEAFELTADDAAFLSTPLASITGLVQTHMTLERGAGLVLEDHFDPVRSLARLREHRATVLGGAPIIVEELFKQAAAEGLEELPLRAMALGGTMIPRPVLELAIDRYGIRPVRVYGASEIPVATAGSPADEGEARLSNDGAASRGVELRTDGEVPGELLVRGPMRFLGYLDPAHNDGTFAHGGWVRTGDLCNVVDGRLTVTGRIKEVVARKGLKISLTEVDAAVLALGLFEEVAAFGLPDRETGERLVLAVHAKEAAEVTFEGLVTDLLSGGLAKYKLPEQVVLWEEPLPRTESGKIQRRAIAEDTQPRRVLLAPRLRS